MSGSFTPPRSPNIIWPSLNILNSCPTQGRVEGWDAMKPQDYRSVSKKGAGRPRLTHHHKGWWNETKWMRWGWRNGGMKFVVGENGRNPEKNLFRPRFVHHETHMEWPRRELGTPAVGGERLTACATRPLWPSLSSIIIHYRRQWPEKLTRPKTSNIHTYFKLYNFGTELHQLNSWGSVDHLPVSTFPEKFLGFSRESKTGLLGW